jgi:osomolarity two-component system sensor histidine kinase TcsA
MDLILTHTPVPTIVVDSTLHVARISLSCLQLLNLVEEHCTGASVYETIRANFSEPALKTLQSSIGECLRSKAIQVLEDILTAEDAHFKARIIPIVINEDLKYVVIELEYASGPDPETRHLKNQAQNNETLNILVNTVKDYAIFILNTDGYIQTWNTGASIMKGYSADEIVGKHFSIFYGEEDRKTDKPGRELEICLRQGKVEDEGWRYRKDGTRFWANVTITAVYQLNKLVGFGKLTRDLTERKMAEERLVSAYQETDKLKSAFLANMSHEIRTPMHGMLCALELLENTPLNEEQQELAGIIGESGSVLLQVINDVLDYSKLASGLQSLSADTFEIAEVIISVSRSIQTTLASNISIEASTASGLPNLVSGDKLRYRQIVQNLGSNAAKFTEDGMISIQVSLIDSDLDGFTILTEVIDTGIGVPESEIDALFKPFTQFDNSATKKYQGTGLGLSICKTLAEIMGGSIGYRANPDKPGSIFWFTAKFQRPSLQIPERLKTTSASIEVWPVLSDSAYSKQLLLVEDNIISQTVMMKLLQKLGFNNIDLASNGQKAVDRVQEDISRYDLILMDISMPVLDGLGATAKIREFGFALPIIAMTANALEGDAEIYLGRGMNGYIAKPVSQRRLLEVLAEWLE